MPFVSVCLIKDCPGLSEREERVFAASVTATVQSRDGGQLIVATECSQVRLSFLFLGRAEILLERQSSHFIDKKTIDYDF